jgi:hypothetical protein
MLPFILSTKVEVTTSTRYQEEFEMKMYFDNRATQQHHET